MVDYDAVVEIDLLFEFEVELGAVFSAIIDSCDSGGGGSNLAGGGASSSYSPTEVDNFQEVADNFLSQMLLIKKYEPEFYQNLEVYILSEEFSIEELIRSKYYKKIMSYRPPVPWR